MNQFYSSLIINSKKFPHVHQVFKPRYNKEFFKRITANIDALEQQIDRRCKDRSDNLNIERLKIVRENSKQLVRLRETLETLDPIQDEEKFVETLTKLQSIEDQVMPTVVRIPNRSSRLVPDEDRIIDEVKSDFQQRQNLTKVLSHRKLSYINNCYSKSVVGPNSHYYFGIGAKLLHGLSEYFATELERENFIPLSGLCMVKSALVEAANCQESKDYTRDPCRILSDEAKYTTLHLAEASRESLLGFITTLGHISSNDPVRLFTTGSCYHQGSDWFDGNDKRVSQSETTHVMILNSSIEAYSMKEYHNFRDIVWQIYKKLELPTRLVHCSLDSMHTNEFDSYRIDIWLPSRQDWLQVSRISHYRDFLTLRVGMRRGHLIDSQLYDGQVLAAAIMENRQTVLGKFLLPNVLADHMIYLTDEEQVHYLGGSKSMPDEFTELSTKHPGQKMSQARVLNNHEQRRYFSHRKYIFGHAKQTWDQKTGARLSWQAKLAIICSFIAASLCDWTEIWKSMVPDAVRKILYDYIYRPPRRIWWNVVYANVPEQRPEDLPWAEVAKVDYHLSRRERYRDMVLKNRFGPEGKELVKTFADEVRQREKEGKDGR